MNNLFTYIDNYGDLDFKEMPINEVDSLILSQLAYFDFAGIPVTNVDFSLQMSQLRPNHLKRKLVEQTWNLASNQQLINLVTQSRRFDQIKIGHYTCIENTVETQQFAAVAFKFSDDDYFIAFKGSDSSLLGWQENMKMPYLSPIPSQLTAVNYVDRIAHRHPGNYWLGGHSKGGNLAVYAAINAHSAIQQTIRSVFDYDGPGFRVGSSAFEGAHAWQQKIHKIIPQTSIFGVMMDTIVQPKIVKSSRFGTSQHDPYSWLVVDNHFVYLEHTSFVSHYTEQAMRTFFKEVDYDSWQHYTDEIFSVFAKCHIDDLSVFNKDPFNSTKKLFTALKTADPVVRQLTTHIIHVLLKNARRQQ